MAGGNAFRTDPKARKVNQDVAKFLRGVPPANTYGRFETGARLSRSFETQAGIPVDGSNSRLRTLSPFTLEIVPPLVFGGSSLLQSGQKPKKNVGIYDAAQQGTNQFYNYLLTRQLRINRAQKTIGNEQRQKLEEFVAAGKQHIKTTPDRTTYAEGTSAFQEPAIADVMVAADIAIQLDTILNTPPLVMLINPTNMSKQFNRLHQYTERTRHGYIYQVWGEDQPKISLSGVTGAFIAGAAPRDIQRAAVAANARGQNSSVSGVQWASKKDSAAWQNLMSLFTFYMNNGYIHDTIGKTYAHHFVGSIAIKYDQWVYIGNIDSFGFGYEENKQYGGLAWNFEFVVAQMFDTAPQVTQVTQMRAPTASPSDPRYSTLGGAPNPARDGAVNQTEPGYTETPPDRVQSASTVGAQTAPAVKSSVGSSKPNKGGFKQPAPEAAPTNFPPLPPQPFGVG